MSKLFSFFCCVLATAALSQSLPKKQPTLPGSLASLQWLIGDWQGTGWQYTSSGQKESFVQHERVEAKLGGTLLQFDGLGMQQRDTVHQALALLYVDQARQHLVFKPFTTVNKDTPATVSVAGSQLTWQMQIDQVGLVRYTIRPGSAGEWIELGEMSRNQGKSWQPFFGMTLTKATRSEAPSWR
jgi:hypothetical protein